MSPSSIAEAGVYVANIYTSGGVYQIEWASFLGEPDTSVACGGHACVASCKYGAHDAPDHIQLMVVGGFNGQLRYFIGQT